MEPRLFKILWVDDEEENIEILRPHVTSWVPDCSGNMYELEIIDRRTYDKEVIELAKDPMVHLIITDLNLLNGDSGSEMIRVMRLNEIYKDILLYSSDAGALRKQLDGLDGIFYYPFVDIIGLRKKICDVIFQCLVKEQYVLARHNL